MKRATSGLLAVTLLAAGCGGSDKPPDREQVSSAVAGFAHAFGRGDGAQACKLLTPGARDAFVARISALVGTRDCAEAVDKLPALAGANVTGPFQTAKVEGVIVSGDSATARLVAGGHAAEVQLEKSDGDWLLTHVPGTSR